MAEETEGFGIRTKRYMKIVVKYAFSHVGLCCLVIGYALIGALTFQAFESQHEFNERRHAQNQQYLDAKREFRAIEEKREEYIRELWTITVDMNILYRENWTRLVRVRLKAFEDLIKDLKKPKETNKTQPQWTFPGALLYSITVITTIGYGNITPKTKIGKITTIFYALLGIPLMFLFLCKIGKLLARTFTVLYRLSCKLCSKKQKKSEESSNSGCLEEIKKHSITEIQFEECTSVTEVPPEGKSLHKTETDVKTQSKKRKGVLISLVVLFITFYICLGALIFYLWEGWNYLDSVYFCFITLSTIGFGDLVPGSLNLNLTLEENHAKPIICCIYLIIGLAFIAMSFTLLQEEVISRCKSNHKKIDHERRRREMIF